MKEIEVGEYVRTKNGISKVIENVDKYVTEEQICVDFISGMYHQVISKHRIVNHSKQPIDLIEVGDIINKELVIGIIDITNDKEEKIGRKLITQYRSAQFTGLDIRYYISADDIKTILTKEQYEANCFKVGGE